MSDYKKILFPTDFSEYANRALPLALGWATYSGAELHALHAIVLDAYEFVAGAADFPSEQEFRNHCETATQRELDSLSGDGPLLIKKVHRSGSAAAQVILDYVADNDIDLIVMATHGRRGPRHLLVGSVTQEVVRKASCPVLTIGQSAEALSPFELSRILVPVDFSDGSATAIGLASRLAAVGSADLELFHVVEQPRYPRFYASVESFTELEEQPGLEEAALEQLEALSEESPLDDGRIRCHTEKGDPGEAILDFSKQRSSNLIVMPTRGLTGMSHVLLGSVADRVVRLASCMVLVVPTKDEARSEAAA